MNLGNFTSDAKTGGYIGSIRTLTIALDNIRIVPRAKDPSAKAGTPDFDILSANGSDLGAGWWQKRASDQLDYISLNIFDPSLNNGQPLRPALWPKKDGTGFTMVLNAPSEPGASVDDAAPLPPAGLNGTGARRARRPADPQ